MEKVLIVLDSPVKVKSISKALNKLGLSFDTSLLELDKFKFLKDPFVSNEESIFNDYVTDEVEEFDEYVDEINKDSSAYTYILIAMDPDEFGDYVSQKIYDQINQKHKVIRCRVGSFDTPGIELAFHASAHMGDSDSTNFESRRILLSALTEQLHNAGCQSDFAAYSIMSHVKKSNIPYGYVRVSMPSDDGGSDYIGDLLVSQANESFVNEYLNEARSMRPLELYAADSQPLTKPWSYIEALVAISDRVGAEHKNVSSVMRNMYMSGQLSFYKTDSAFMAESAIDKVTKIASEHGISIHRGDDADVGSFSPAVLNDSNLKPSFHGALHVVSNDVDLTSPLKILKIEDIVSSMISRNLILSGMKFRVEYPYIDEAPEWMRSINFRRVGKVKLPWIESDQREHFTLNVYNRFSVLLELYGKLDLFKWDPDAVDVVDEIIKQEIISKRLCLNYKGMSIMSKSPAFAVRDGLLSDATTLLAMSNEIQPYKRAESVLKQLIGL